MFSRSLLPLTLAAALLGMGLPGAGPTARAADREIGDIVDKGTPKPVDAQSLADVPGRRYALLVGVNDYTFFSDLTFCDDDIAALSRTLEKTGFDPRDLTVLRDGLKDHHLLPYRNNIVTQLSNLLASVQKNDLVLVAFSGHGVHLDGKSYLCPADAQLDRAGDTMVSLDQVYELLQNSPASQKVLIVDACRNDPTPAGTRSPSTIAQTNEFTRSLQQQQPPQGTVLFNSCAPNQYSVEDPGFKSGVFMHYLIEGLRGGADADKDEKVSLFELYRYAEYETKTFVRRTRNLVQTPVLKGELTGVYELAVVSDETRKNPYIPEPIKADAEAKKVDIATTLGGATEATEERSPKLDAPKPTNNTAKPKNDQVATRAAVEAHPLLKQGNRQFAEKRYAEAIGTLTNIVKLEEDKNVLREALKLRSASYLALDASQYIERALADSQAAGRQYLTAVVRKNDAQLMVGSQVVAQIGQGNTVEISEVRGEYLAVVGVNGNEAMTGWLNKSALQQTVQTVETLPQQTFPQNGGGGFGGGGNGNNGRPCPTDNCPTKNGNNGNGGNHGNGGGNNGGNDVRRQLEQQVMRHAEQFLKKKVFGK
jgi:uncharacterized caspase-like protein